MPPSIVTVESMLTGFTDAVARLNLDLATVAQSVISSRG